MSTSLLPLLLENSAPADPLLLSPTEDMSLENEGRCWNWVKNSAKNAFQFSRRYSIVATQVGILALDTVFLISKAEEDSPEKMGEIALILLSSMGILSLHYTADWIWKSVQDAKFALKMANKEIACLSTFKVVQNTSDGALVLGNFYAAMQGVTGHPDEQTAAYQNMILWGEISLASGLGLVLLSLYATYRTNKQLNEEVDDPKTAANIRFCMDKDTLWHLIQKLQNLKEEEQQELENILEIVKKNIDTQLKVTMGGQLVLVVAGYVLQAIEKAYTPNSLVSAAIGFSVATAYAIRMCAEKAIEYVQRGKLDALADNSNSSTIQ